MSWSSTWTPWARTVPGPSSPVSWSTSIGVRPWRSRTAASSAAVSQACTWTRAPCVEASSPTARSCGSSSRYVLCGQTQRRPAGVAASRSAAQVRRSSKRRWSAPGNSTKTGPPRRSNPASAATALAASGKKYMSSAVVIPARRHSATASRTPAVTVSGDSSAPSAGSSRARKPSRSRSSARPRNIVIARWAWALTSPGRTIAPRASMTRWADAGGSPSPGASIAVIVSPSTRTVAPWRTEPAASIVTTVASTIARSCAVMRPGPPGSPAAARRGGRRRRHRRR